jgi:competence protein ComEC
MASSAALAPSTGFGPLQTAGWRPRAPVERWLEAERDQLPLWLPVALGAGVAAWFALPTRIEWLATIAAALAIACIGLAAWRGGRAGVAVAIGGVSVALGVALGWSSAERARAPVLGRPVVATILGTVERVQSLPARDLERVTVRPTSLTDNRGQAVADAPTRVRVNIAAADMPAGLTAGASVRLRARLMPPAAPAVPGAYDFGRVAWFAGLGATGRAFAPVTVVAPGRSEDGLRSRLSRLIEARVPGSAGGIAAALATGDTGAIADEDAEAMRRAGLAHLLSVSGLHITAAVGLTMWLVLRLLALSPALALTGRLPLVAGGAAALVAIGYTLLTGAEVPTVRSCVAALLVLAALAAGRQAVTLRLVAAGAAIVILVWPESVAGPSFQLSFAAVTAIVALHEHPRVRGRFLKRDEAWWRKGLREFGSLLLTGIVVEAALMPIAVYHFHKAGLYGAAANIVAIPLTTFVVMPLEALALVAEPSGVAAPLWWLLEQALAVLLWIARSVAAAPGAVASLPAMPDGAFALVVAGGLWAALWRTGWRWLGAAPFATGIVWALATPTPDLLVTGDGRHLALRTAAGVALLRDRAGDYTMDTLAENGGVDGDPVFLVDQPEARCTRDLCIVDRQAGGRRWRVVATRSSYRVPVAELIDACRSADIMVSERPLPRRCRPSWLRLDRDTLAKTGGAAVTLATGRVVTVLHPGDEHPWRALNRSGGAAPRAFPERGPGRGRSAADRRRDWRDRAGSWRLRDGNT